MPSQLRIITVDSFNWDYLFSGKQQVTNKRQNQNVCRNPDADAFTQDRGWFDEYERFWSDVLTAHRHHQNTKLRIHALYPPSTVPHTDKEHWSFCGGSRWDCTLLTHFMVGFRTSPLCRWVFIWRFKWNVVSSISRCMDWNTKKLFHSLLMPVDSA